MITEEHFEALRELRQASKALGIACAEITGPTAFIHEAFDHVITRPSREERDLLKKMSYR